MTLLNAESDVDLKTENLQIESSSDALRACGGCTACCTVLAVDELRKPMRWACEHLACDGCRIYETRPKGCRDFDCLWLRGEICGDESRRPDRLGVIVDSFRDAATNNSRFVAFEVWTAAFAEPAAAALLAELSATREVQLSSRAGSWRTIGPGSRATP
jgi:hypothetical protein